MKFDIDERDIGKIHENLLQHKLFVANLALNDIPHKMPPVQNSKEYFSMETNIEIFLLFLTSAHDAIFNEINQKFGTGLNKPSYYDLETKLDSLDNEKAKNIAKLISQYFKRPKLKIKKISKEQAENNKHTESSTYGLYPSIIEFNGSKESLNELTKWSSQLDISNLEHGYYERYWDYSNSSQWIATQLRNEIAHGLQIIPFSYKDRNKIEKTTFIVSFTYSDRSNTDEFWFEEENPYNFFLNQFEQMNEFELAVRENLPEIDEQIFVKRPSIEFIRGTKD